MEEKIRDQHMRQVLSAKQGEEHDENSEAGAPAEAFNLSSVLHFSSSKDQGKSKCSRARTGEGSLGAVDSKKKKSVEITCGISKAAASCLPHGAEAAKTEAEERQKRRRGALFTFTLIRQAHS